MNGQELSLFDVIGKMGIMGISISALIALLSVIVVYVFFERLIALKYKNDDTFVQSLNETLSVGNFNAAKDMCVKANTPLSRVLYKGLLRMGMPLKDIEMSLERAIDLEVFNMEKGEEILSLVSKLAPMLGFIGTIAGVIQIFYTISTTGDYNIESISGGLYVKMITSALGLSLGILAYFFYFVIARKVKKNIFQLEKGASQLIDIISIPNK